MKYTIDYFISKFEKIPEENLIVEHQNVGGSERCALGWCNHGNNELAKEYWGLIKVFKDIRAISGPAKYGWNVADVNNGDHPDYQQPTPKQRILAALRDIKKMTNEQNAQECDATDDDQRTERWKNKQGEFLNLIPIIEEVSDLKTIEADC